jgi:hypothetical protein
VASPAPLSSTPFTSSAMKTQENTEEDPDDAKTIRRKKYPNETLL